MMTPVKTAESIIAFFHALIPPQTVINLYLGGKRMKVETNFLSKKLRIDYIVDGEEKLKSITLANLNKDATAEQLGQIVDGIKALINGQVAKIYVTEVDHGIVE